MFESVFYNKPVVSDNVVYSCDSILIDGKLNFNTADFLERYLNLLDCGIEVEYHNSRKLGCYFHLWTFRWLNGSSSTFMLSFNDGKRENDKYRFDFNPNKCFDDDEFKKFHDFILSISKYADLKRWDFAVDYPVLRENCFLRKDNRLYSCVMASISDRTEYLGRRNHHGFVKLYNKQIESNLSSPLTRLEITIEGNMPFDTISVPSVYLIEDLQLAFDSDFSGLGGTDTVLLLACLDDINRLSYLPQKKKNKIECILAKYTRFLSIDSNCYTAILSQALSHCKPYGVIFLDTSIHKDNLKVVNGPF